MWKTLGILLRTIVVLAAVVWVAGAALGDAPADTAQTPKNLQQALEDFRAAAARLEKAIQHRAGETTSEVRRGIDQHLGSVLKDISTSMNHAAHKLEGAESAPGKGAATSDPKSHVEKKSAPNSE